MGAVTREELVLTSRWCIVCEHRWHDERCSLYQNGAPLFSSHSCMCSAGVELDDIDAALYSLRQYLPKWDVNYLVTLATALGRSIPDLPTRAEAHIYGRKRRDGD